jgi:hypothetical protein
VPVLLGHLVLRVPPEELVVTLIYVIQQQTAAA